MNEKLEFNKYGVIKYLTSEIKYEEESEEDNLALLSDNDQVPNETDD
jgi:hypothetical protein